LTLALLDALLTGAWAALVPGGLLALLGAPPSPDALLLVRALGGLTLAQVPCLALALLGPARYRGLVVAPLVGRALLVGLWLWLLGSERADLPARPLHLLLAHEVVLLGACAGGLIRGKDS
jgi:hypothetical protein